MINTKYYNWIEEYLPSNYSYFYHGNYRIPYLENKSENKFDESYLKEFFQFHDIQEGNLGSFFKDRERSVPKSDPIQQYEVVPYYDANRRAVKGDRLEGHHVIESYWMKSNIGKDSYNPKDAWTLVMYDNEHKLFHREHLPNQSDLDFSQKLAGSLWQLHKQGVPNEVIREFKDMAIISAHESGHFLGIEKHYNPSVFRALEREGLYSPMNTHDNLSIGSYNHVNHLTHGLITDAAFSIGRKLSHNLDNPMSIMNTDSLLEIGSNAIIGIPHHLSQHYFEKIVIGGASIATAGLLLPAEGIAAGTIAAGAGIHTGISYASCMNEHEHLIRDLPYDYRNVSSISSYCRGDAFLNTVGSINLAADTIISVGRGMRSEPIIPGNLPELSNMGKVWNNLHFGGHKLVNGIGYVINIPSHLMSNAMNYMSPQQNSLQQIFNKNNEQIMNSIMGDNVFRHQNIFTPIPNNSHDSDQSNSCLIPYFEGFRNSTSQIDISNNESLLFNHQDINNSGNFRSGFDDSELKSANNLGSDFDNPDNFKSEFNGSGFEESSIVNYSKNLNQVSQVDIKHFDKTSLLDIDSIISGSPEVRMLLSGLNNMLSNGLIIKNWSHLSDSQKLNIGGSYIISNLVGPNQSLASFLSLNEDIVTTGGLIEMDNELGKGLALLAEVMRNGKVTVEGIAVSLVNLNSTVPMGGLLKLGTDLLHKISFKNALNDCLPDIMRDIAFYFVPNLGAVKLAFDCLSQVKKLITHHSSKHVGAFEVNTKWRKSLKGFFKHGVTTKYTAELPYLHIEVVIHENSKDNAEAEALKEVERLAKLRTYAKMGIDFDDLNTEDEKASDESTSEDGADVKDEKIPTFEDFKNFKKMEKLFKFFEKDLMEKDKVIFERQWMESKEDKEKRIESSIKGIKESLLNKHKNIPINEFIEILIKDFSLKDRTSVLISIFHIFYDTNKDFHIPEICEEVLKALKFDLDKFYEFFRTQNDKSNEQVEKEKKEILEEESKDFYDWTNELEKIRSKERIVELENYGQNEKAKVATSSKDEVKPLILLLGFFEYIGIDPHIFMSDGTIKNLKEELITKGEYCRENIIFWLNTETIKSHISTGFIVGSTTSAGFGMACGTLAYIDMEIPRLANSPGGYIVSKTSQVANSTLQIVMSSTISACVCNTFRITKYAEQFCDETIKIIQTNISGGVSFGVGAIRSVMDGSIKGKTMLENIWDISEMIVRNNIVLINDFLLSNYEVIKSASLVVADYATWILEYLDANFSENYIYSILAPFMSLEPNSLLTGVLICLGCRILKACIFSGIRLLYNMSFSESLDESNKELQKIKRTNGLIDMLKSLNDKKDKTLKDKVDFLLIQKELMMEGVIPPSISISIDNCSFKKIFTENDEKQLNDIFDGSIIVNIPETYKYKGYKTNYYYQDYKCSYFYQNKGNNRSLDISINLPDEINSSYKYKGRKTCYLYETRGQKSYNHTTKYKYNERDVSYYYTKSNIKEGKDDLPKAYNEKNTVYELVNNKLATKYSSFAQNLPLAKAEFLTNAPTKDIPVARVMATN